MTTSGAADVHGQQQQQQQQSGDRHGGRAFLLLAWQKRQAGKHDLTPKERNT